MLIQKMLWVSSIPKLPQINTAHVGTRLGWKKMVVVGLKAGLHEATT